VRDFLREAGGAVREMRRAAEAGERDRVSRQARALAARARAVGLLRVAQTSADIAEGERQDGGAVDRLAAQLAPALDDLAAWRPGAH
jgi:HPt (histidine-containing phosphotransfer) domain-containing protein